MLTSFPFYHGITRKCIVAVGGLFSNIYTVSKDASGTTQKIVNVPLAFLNKDKFMVRLQQDTGLNEDLQIQLPRLSYEIVGFEYDSARQLNKINKVVCEKNGQTVQTYSPVPYNLNINLYSYTKTTEDNLQIMEQILPYFTPDMNLSIKVMQNPDLVHNCSFTLESVNLDDSYDGSFEDRRYIISTYSFILKMIYFGPLLGLTDAENHFKDGSQKPSIIKQVTVNVNTNKYSAVIDPFEANESDAHTIQETWSTRSGGVDDFDVGETV